jgi:hypothetical protein
VLVFVRVDRWQGALAHYETVRLCLTKTAGGRGACCAYKRVEEEEAGCEVIGKEGGWGEWRVKRRGRMGIERAVLHLRLVYCGVKAMIFWRQRRIAGNEVGAQGRREVVSKKFPLNDVVPKHHCAFGSSYTWALTSSSNLLLAELDASP